MSAFFESSGIQSVPSWTDGTAGEWTGDGTPDTEIPGVVVQDFDIDDLRAFDPAKDPANLAGRRYCCVGSTGLIAGGSGYGKSTLVMQIAIYWASNSAFFGIAPVRALKILIVQDENNLGDEAEMMQGVIRGIAKSGDMREAKLWRIAKKNVIIKRIIGATGAAFLCTLEALIRKYSPDMVFVDPLFAFAGCALTDTPAISKFLREGLIPLATRCSVCVQVVHHVVKPARDNDAKASWSEADFQYLGFGSSEIVNAFRSVSVLLPVANHEGTYRLILSKRGSRAGALDIDGEHTMSLYLQHSKEGLCWEQIARPDAEVRFQRKYTDEDVLEHLSRTSGTKTGATQKRVCEETGMAKRTFHIIWERLKKEQKIKVDSGGLWLRK